MPLRAITSERLCNGHPSARSPATALHQAGFGAALHGWMGDCAMASDEPAMITANAIRQIEFIGTVIHPGPPPAGDTRCPADRASADARSAGRGEDRDQKHSSQTAI